MARKFLLVAVTVWFGRDPSYQIYAGTWVLLIATLLQVVCQPYEDPHMGFLESVSLCATFCSLLLGNAIALGGLSPNAEKAVRIVVALLNVAMLCFFGLCFARSMRQLGNSFKERKSRRRQRESGLAQIANPMVAVVQQNQGHDVQARNERTQSHV